MCKLIDAYLDFCLRDSGDGFPTEEPAEANDDHEAHPSGTVSGIELLDIFSELSSLLVIRNTFF